jgi:hypothetical protein
MSILSIIRDLIKGSPDAENATTRLIDVLASEAIKTGDPDALVAVAAQWQELLEGRIVRQALPAAAGSTPGSFARTLTPPDALRTHVLEVMSTAWLNGIEEVTTGVIQKGVDRLVRANGGWTDADLEDVSPNPGIQHRWRLTLSTCLKDMRLAGEVRNDPRATKTYTLTPRMRPALPAAPERPALEPSWEVLGGEGLVD